MKKIDIRDVSFLIPIRLDSLIRLENLIATTTFINKHFDTTIFVLEIASYNNRMLQKLLNKTIKYDFVEDKDPIFHRTKYRNIMTEKVFSPFLAIWDADVLVQINQIVEVVSKLRNNEVDMAYPFNGCFYDTTTIIRNLYITTRRFSVLQKFQCRMLLPYGKNHKGGAFFTNTAKYIQSGMENENFYGWGPEDYERYERWKKLGFRIHFANGVMYHLSHPRDINGHYSSQNQRRNSIAELARTIKSSISPTKPL